MRSIRSTLVFVSVAGLCAAASAGPFGLISPIFSSIAGAPSNAVPGMGGLGFFSGTAVFERPYRSADGSRWVMRARSNNATVNDWMIISGMGPSAAGAQVVLQEGQATPWDPNVNVETIVRRNVGINNNGDIAMVANTNGATASDEHIVRRNASGTWDVIAREGDATPAGGAYGLTLDSAHILNNGDVGFINTSVTGLTTATNAIAVRGGSLIAHKGVTIPGNQAGGATAAWQNFTTDEFYTSADGAHYMLTGDTDDATTVDGVIVVDGQVVIQEGVTVLSGFSNPVSTTNREAFMMSNGDWYARGSNSTDNLDWVVQNGNVIARTGDTITGSTSERFSDTAGFTATFFFMAGDNNGNYVVGGVTDAADPSANAVLIYNGTTELIREGAMVDINGDGLMNDDAFVSVFNNDDGFLTDDGHFYFTADLRDATGATIGQAFLVMQVPAPSGALVLGAAGLAAMRRRR
ncbi:MAG: hypothetical protein AB7G17_04555 [Phycisphaerales bacterium]